MSFCSKSFLKTHLVSHWRLSWKVDKMNSAKTFVQNIGQKKTVKPPSLNPNPNPNPNVNPRIDENERVFTFNIKTIQNHIKNDFFGSIFTIFEVFGKEYFHERFCEEFFIPFFLVRVHKVVEVPKATKFTLRDLDNINTMEAVCYQTGLNIRNGTFF